MNIEPIPSKSAWELEYDDPQLLTRAPEPTKEFRDFVAWLRKEESLEFDGKRVLDLGCGTGRNLLYVLDRADITGVGTDISQNALRMAKEKNADQTIEWLQHDLEKPLPEIGEFDVVIDSTTTHLLPRRARESLALRLGKIVRPGGYVYLRTLTADGDRNAHNLMRDIPGPEKGSYVHPKLGVVEYMLTQKEIEALYSQDFVVRFSRKYTGYQKWGPQSYKRRYVTLYLQRLHE